MNKNYYYAKFFKKGKNEMIFQENDYEETWCLNDFKKVTHIMCYLNTSGYYERKIPYEKTKDCNTYKNVSGDYLFGQLLKKCRNGNIVFF